MPAAIGYTQQKRERHQQNANVICGGVEIGERGHGLQNPGGRSEFASLKSGSSASACAANRASSRSPLLGFEEAGELHAYHVRLACLALLQRNPIGPDLPDLLKRLYLEPARKKAAAMYQARNRSSRRGRFIKRSKSPKSTSSTPARSRTEAVTLTRRPLRTEGNLIRTGTLNKLEFREPVKFVIEFLFVRNPDLLGNGRLPLVVQDFKYKESPFMRSLIQEFPASGRFLALCSCLSPDAGERPTSYGYRDSSRQNACYLPDTAGSRVRAGAFRARYASSKHDLFAPRGFVFLFGEFSIGLQDHFKRILQVFASLFQSLALGVDARNFLHPGSPPIIYLLIGRGQLHAHIFIGFGLLVQSLAANEIVQKPLDEFVIYNAEQINAQQNAYAEALLEQNRVMKERIDQLQKNESVIRSLQSEVERLKKESGSGKGPTPAEEGKANPSNDFSFRDTPDRAEDEISDPGEIVLFPRSEADCQAFLVSQMRLNNELAKAHEALERRKLLNLFLPLFPSRTYLALITRNTP